MILPNVRASLGPEDLDWIVDLVASVHDRSRSYAEQRLVEEGTDAILDDPRVLNAILSTRSISPVRAPVTFYVLIRQAMLESGLDDRVLADYLAALLLDFGGLRPGSEDRSETEQFFYLVDVIAALETAGGRRAFMLRAYLGEMALWMTGMFPDRVGARVQRRGAPGMRYYEEVGAAGYRLAASSEDAAAQGLDDIFQQCARLFPLLRVTLNRVSDRYLFPRATPSTERLLRQLGDAFDSGPDGGS